MEPDRSVPSLVWSPCMLFCGVSVPMRRAFGAEILARFRAEISVECFAEFHADLFCRCRFPYRIFTQMDQRMGTTVIIGLETL